MRETNILRIPYPHGASCFRLISLKLTLIINMIPKAMPFTQSSMWLEGQNCWPEHVSECLLFPVTSSAKREETASAPCQCSEGWGGSTVRNAKGTRCKDLCYIRHVLRQTCANSLCFVFPFIHLCVCGGIKMSMWRSGINLWGSVFFFHYMNLGT